jgi:hypothetical protein
MQLARRLQPRSKIVLRTCASRNDIIDGIMFAMEEMLQAKPRGKHARYVTPDVAFAEASGTSFVRYAEMLVKEAYASGRLATTGRTKSMRVMELQYAIYVLCWPWIQSRRCREERLRASWEQRRFPINVPWTN